MLMLMLRLSKATGNEWRAAHEQRLLSPSQPWNHSHLSLLIIQAAPFNHDALCFLSLHLVFASSGAIYQRRQTLAILSDAGEQQRSSRHAAHPRVAPTGAPQLEDGKRGAGHSS